MDGLRCIDEFTYRCLDVEHRNYFNTLYQGTTQVIVDLCQRGQYQSGKSCAILALNPLHVCFNNSKTHPQATTLYLLNV